MNIKIGKGGSGKINSTKGGSGKLIERKYIDLLPSPSNLTFLFDSIFYKKDIANTFNKIIATGSALSYVNGIYSQTVNPKKIYTKPFQNQFKTYKNLLKTNKTPIQKPVGNQLKAFATCTKVDFGGLGRFWMCFK